MAYFKIVTDSTADLPKEYLREHKIGCMSVPYTVGGNTYKDEVELEYKKFYEMMRNGEMPVTSQVNPLEIKQYLESYLEESKELLYLAFSSGLSGSYNNGRLAVAEIMEEREDVKIIVIDTLCASLGEGLLVHKAVQKRDAGCTLEETAKWIEEHKMNLVHVFTVDDLNHLYRGGRVNKVTAVIGTLAGIKPILHVDESGHLIPVAKVRGRKKSLHALVEYMKEHMGSYHDQNDIIFISHGDALEDAEYVRKEIEDQFGIEHFLIHNIGPTIGTHSGPGTIALFFMGDKR